METFKVKVTHNFIFGTDKEAEEFFLSTIHHKRINPWLVSHRAQEPKLHGRAVLVPDELYRKILQNET